MLCVGDIHVVDFSATFGDSLSRFFDRDLEWTVNLDGRAMCEYRNMKDIPDTCTARQ